MPFTSTWIEENIVNSTKTGRLAHTFLITGNELNELEKLFYRLAALLLKNENPQHPDLHLLRPESKTRRITVEQVRELEHSLQLKPHHAPYKISGILSADRMCLGAAEPANAFLKTLEEPPEHTIIFLLTDRPELLLPTIRSRCLILPLKTDHPEPDENLKALSQAWLDAKGLPADIAYRRASMLAEYWQSLRAEIEVKFKTELKEAESEDDELIIKANIESQLILLRDRSIAHLITTVWSHSQNNGISHLEAELTCESFEELRLALSRNLDQALCIERCCLKISRLI